MHKEFFCICVFKQSHPTSNWIEGQRKKIHEMSRVIKKQRMMLSAADSPPDGFYILWILYIDAQFQMLTVACHT